MMKRIVLWGSLSLALVQPVLADGRRDAAPMVRTALGQVLGVTTVDGRSAVYKGIPFAMPPVGRLRWRAPVPAGAWTGVRDATRFSADCVQRPRAQEPGRRFSEDCLYLNVWAPLERADGKALPVLLWIYGGSFTHGGASQPAYDGARLAGRGMIVVTFNYRVGPLGFMAHPALTAEAGASGNYGIMDQLAALKWVHAHIAPFGGDPKRMTLAGQSAGAISVNALMAARGAQGLFAGAIVQSGPLWGMSPPTRDRSHLEALGLRMMASRGLTSIAQLRALPAEDLAEATPEEIGVLAMPFGPIVDGALLTQSSTERFLRGEEAAVPLLIGDTADEFSRFVPEMVTPLAFERQIRSDFGSDADHYLGLYPHASSADARRARLQSLVYPIHDGTVSEAQAHAVLAPTFLYRFEQAPPGPNAARLGAYHGADVSYMFDAIAQAAGPWTQVDRALSRTMADYWTNFVKTGRPGGPGLPDWPAYDPANPMLMRLGEEPGAMPLLDRGRIRAARRPHDVRWVMKFERP